MLKSLRDHFLRVDARSLGLFRIAMALVLLGDLFGRWRWLRDFYSNEGVLPNHNHLFLLRGKQDVFSLLHAFSSVGDARVAFLGALIVYVFFLVGYKTRAFHALSLVVLVSLTSRNILAEGPGNYAAIALLAFTLFLPCGSRLSLDSVRRSMDLRDEKDAADLNDRARPDEATVADRRHPGWSPASIAALAVLAQIAAIYACSALQQRGDAWRDGTALYYALHVDRWVSGLGARVRDLPAGSLSAWTHLLRGVELAVPALLVVPALFRWTRTLAAALMVLHGLTLGLLFDFGLFGWSLVAAAALVLPGAAWDAIEGSPRPRRTLTVIYDADCGVCLWLARLLKRADLRHNLTFQGNDDVGELLVRGPSGAIDRAPMPKEVTPELTSRSVVVVDRDGRVFTRGRAVVEQLRALPIGGIALVLRVPGLSHALDALYDAVAARRQRISVLMGKDACAIGEGAGPGAQGAFRRPGAPEVEPDVEPDGEGAASGDRAGEDLPSSPALRTARYLSGSIREAAAAILLAAMLAQTARANPVPGGDKIPQGKLLAAVASWPRMLARWDLLAPEPPRDNGLLVVDAQTRAEEALDPLTGRAPQLDLAASGPTRMGQLWSSYEDRIRQKEWSDFQRALRDYLAKGGPMTGGEPVGIIGFDAYWVSRPIPPPGQPPAAETTKEKLFSHSRGGLGRTNLDGTPAAPRPSLKRRDNILRPEDIKKD